MPTGVRSSVHREDAKSTVKSLAIVWQRLVDDQGRTCERCGVTQRAVEAAAAKLGAALRPLGIEVRLQGRVIDRDTFDADPSQSNRLWIAGRPIEDWLGAGVASSPCCAVCGSAECRTMEVGGEVIEAIPAELILRAGLTAAGQMIDCSAGEAGPTSDGAARHRHGKMEIRQYRDEDWAQVWPMLERVFRAGETYAFAPDISEKAAREAWIEAPLETYVALDAGGDIVGTYYIKPNQPGLGDHVCNCGYVVAESARGQGVATAMCEHSQQVAVHRGFRAMQYNLVVSTNEGAIRLWKKLGFQVAGTLPGAFRSRTAGYVDALVMYKELKDAG